MLDGVPGEPGNALPLRRQAPGKVVIDKSHYRGYRATKDGTLRLAGHQLRERFLNVYPKVDEFIRAVKVQKRINPSQALTRIVNIFDGYLEDECIRAMENCEQYNNYSPAFIQGLLDSSSPAPSAKTRHQLDLGLLHVPRSCQGVKVKRDLKEYRL